MLGKLCCVEDIEFALGAGSSSDCSGKMALNVKVTMAQQGKKRAKDACDCRCCEVKQMVESYNTQTSSGPGIAAQLLAYFPQPNAPTVGGQLFPAGPPFRAELHDIEREGFKKNKDGSLQNEVWRYFLAPRKKAPPHPKMGRLQQIHSDFLVYISKKDAGAGGNAVRNYYKPFALPDWFKKLPVAKQRLLMQKHAVYYGATYDADINRHPDTTWDLNDKAPGLGAGGGGGAGAGAGAGAGKCVVQWTDQPTCACPEKPGRADCFTKFIIMAYAKSGCKGETKTRSVEISQECVRTDWGCDHHVTSAEVNELRGDAERAKNK